jgi:parallel beta-helix repeat protein
MAIRSARSVRLLLLLFVAALLVPVAAAAQAVLSVSPTSVSAQATQGTDAASQTVRVSNSGRGALKWSVVQPTATWLSVSPVSGVNTGTLTLTFRTSSLSAGNYQTSFRVEASGSASVVSVALSIVAGSSPPPPPPPTLTVTCPANMSVTSPDGSPVVVTYSVTTSGGTPPVTVTGTPASGSSFPVGTTPVQVTAESSDGQKASCSFSVTVTYSPPPPSSGVGPQSTITCPAGAVDIWPGASIQAMVDSHVGNTTFCLRAGIHPVSSSITPKTGNRFIGQYGAIIDGSGWTTTDTTEAAFRAHNQDIDSVTIRNLVIRNMHQRGIHAFHQMSNNWTIENNEIAHNGSGIVFPSGSIIRNNYIHHNTSGAYLGVFAHNSLLENNEIAFNGREQKIGESANVTFRNNFVHHNSGDGIWFDNNNTGALVEGNRVEDNLGSGIFYEISSGIIIRNNVIRRSGEAAVFISTSKNAQIYNNTLEHNFRGITYFVNCSSVGGGTIAGGFDLANNSAHDNTIVVGTQSGAFASLFSWTSCNSSQVWQYESGSKNLTFSNNTYAVPSPTTVRYWFWNGPKFWNEWQALGHDATGTVR